MSVIHDQGNDDRVPLLSRPDLAELQAADDGVQIEVH